MQWTALGVAGLMTALGCTEDPVAPADAATPVDLGTPADTGSPDDGGLTDRGGPADTGAPDVAPTGAVVVNEVRASGDDWIELFNRGAAPVDLGGYGVADLDADAGTPRIASAVRFPAGTVLAPGAFLFVRADVADAGVGPQTACLDGGPSTCFHAPWGISASRGETVSLLDPQGHVVAQGVYPMNAVTTGRSWGRLPDGTGAFAATLPTPGAPNQAP